MKQYNAYEQNYALFVIIHEAYKERIWNSLDGVFEGRIVHAWDRCGNSSQAVTGITTCRKRGASQPSEILWLFERIGG